MLTILTNHLSQIHDRIGFGSTNKPELRQQLILNQIQKNNLGYEIQYHEKYIPKQWLEQLHDPDYLYFLENVYHDWTMNNDPHWIDDSFGIKPNHYTKYKINDKIPLYKMSGYYGMDFMTPIYKDTYQNCMSSAYLAYLSGEIVQDNKIVYVLANVPGHHARSNQYGGYCFLNNSIIAAYRMAELGKIVGILDIDYHAGSFEIVNKNSGFDGKLFCCSIHMDPLYDYPSYEGFESENCDYIKNVVLHPNTSWDSYKQKLIDGCEYLINSGINGLVIAFGADTYKEDPDPSPLGKLSLELNDYCAIGKTIKQYFGEMPIIITQEGGYDLDHVPEIVSNLLEGLK